MSSRSFYVGFLLALGCLVARAGQLGVDPVRLTLAKGAMSASLVIENQSDKPTLVQSELMAWSQKDGEDILTPTQDLVVSPPIFTIAPGSTQTVRVGLLRPADAQRELTYRLILQEVPPPIEAKVGVTVAMRIGLPVFILPAARAAPQLKWHATRGTERQIGLTLENSGNAHVQAIDCKLYRPDGTVAAEHKLAGYVLPGQTRTWPVQLTGDWAHQPLRLAARTDAGDISVELVPE